MKKIISFIVLISMMMALIACSSVDSEVDDTISGENVSNENIEAEEQASQEVNLNNTIGDGTFTVKEEFDHTAFNFEYPDIKSILETDGKLNIYFLVLGKSNEGYQHEIDDKDYRSSEAAIYISPTSELPIMYQAESGQQYHDTEYIIEEDSVSILIPELRFDVSVYPYIGIQLLSEGDSLFWEEFAPEDVLVKYEGKRNFLEFEDPLIEKFVSLEYNIPVGQITLEDLERVKKISINDFNIEALEGAGIIGEDGKGNFTSLEDLRYMPNLEIINLVNHQISDISILGELPNLRYIELSGNNISDISVLADVKSLEDVFLNDNNISDMSPLSNLTNLEHVYLDGNKITTIADLSKSETLYTISLKNNQITDVTPLNTNVIIEWIMLDYNNITDVSPMVQMHTLRELSLEGNPISDISPLGSTGLFILNVKGTNVTDFSAVEHFIVILERD